MKTPLSVVQSGPVSVNIAGPEDPNFGDYMEIFFHNMFDKCQNDNIIISGMIEELGFFAKIHFCKGIRV